MSERFLAYIYKQGASLKEVELDRFGNVVEDHQTKVGEIVIIRYCPVECMPLEEIFDTSDIGEEKKYPVSPLPLRRN